MEYLVAEFKRGSKIYIGEMISLTALLLFFIFLPKMTGMLESSVGGMILMSWFGINAMIITIYTLYDFITLMMGEQNIEKGLSQVMLFKVLFFETFFGVNMFLLIIGSSVAVPILALMGTFLVLASTKKYFNKKAPYLCLGILWYVTLFILAYISYRVVYILLYGLIANPTIIGGLTTILFFTLSFFIFIVLLKKINQVKC